MIGRWDPETGSFPEVDLEQDDPEAKISRKHALIIIEGGKITIEDIGSLNGTYVNRGNRLIPGTPLEVKAGDEADHRQDFPEAGDRSDFITRTEFTAAAAPAALQSCLWQPERRRG